MLPDNAAVAGADEYIQALNLVLKLVEYGGKAVGSLRRQKAEALDRRIIGYMQGRESVSASIVWADVFLRPIIEDVPFGIAFPPQLSGWKRFKFELKRLPYETRHRWRKWAKLVPEKKVEKRLEAMAASGTLIRVPYPDILSESQRGDRYKLRD